MAKTPHVSAKKRNSPLSIIASYMNRRDPATAKSPPKLDGKCEPRLPVTSALAKGAPIQNHLYPREEPGTCTKFKEVMADNTDLSRPTSSANGSARAESPPQHSFKPRAPAIGVQRRSSPNSPRRSARRRLPRRQRRSFRLCRGQ